MKPLQYTLNPTRLTGPIFDKELRVASRRRRNYVLRTVYVLVLTFFLVFTWTAVLRYASYQGPGRIAYLAQASQELAATIVWVQFVLTQLLAIVILANAISDESAARTLGVLMTTPITSLQIVLGKLLSRLLQLFLLVAVSLPLLAFLRVFGGIPWDYLVTSLAITTTAMIFNGLLSLYLSIYCKRPYVVILLALAILAILYLLLPLFTVAILDQLDLMSSNLIPYLCLANPWFNLQIRTMTMQAARFMPFAMSASCLWHCAIMLGASAVLFVLSVRAVRRAALRQIGGDSTPAPTPTIAPVIPPASAAANPATQSAPRQHVRTHRRIHGCPVLWRELRSPFLRSRRAAWIVSIIAALLLFGSYLALQNDLNDDDVHMVYACVFLALGAIVTAVLPAAAITSEKEARSWPILLATPLTTRNIIHAKWLGAIRRCLPVWIPFAGHLIFFAVVGYVHPITFILIPLIVAGMTCFLTGTGLYFSARFKKTTTAVIANLLLTFGLWLFSIPIVALIAITLRDDDVIEPLANLHPFVQAAVVMDAAAGHNTNLRFHWPDPIDTVGPIGTIIAIAFIAALYATLGLFAAWRAQVRLRKDIF